MTFKIGRAAIGQRILGPASGKEYLTVAYLPPGAVDHDGTRSDKYRYVCRRTEDQKLVTFHKRQYRQGFKIASGERR